MRSYSVPAQNVALATAAANTPLHLAGAASIRPQIQEFDIGPRSSADTVYNFSLSRSTNANSVATGSALTEAELDDAMTQAATAVGTSGALGTVYTTAPTFGDAVFTFGVHQRTAYRWIAQPGREPQAAAAATAGFAFQIHAVTAFNADITLSWDE